ncbi:hypothetical protein GCM10010123_29180 [Pilimelia anulata]|uniref:Uncharacterized protein n=1 Tax=Pilimelia anulata TaxID=53371 RepID=A0A8J3B6J3_9ACTN|nr:hypothetical protein GCM10010123_29180 [Pilimelia anulata]
MGRAAAAPDRAYRDAAGRGGGASRLGRVDTHGGADPTPDVPEPVRDPGPQRRGDAAADGRGRAGGEQRGRAGAARPGAGGPPATATAAHPGAVPAQPVPPPNEPAAPDRPATARDLFGGAGRGAPGFGGAAGAPVDAAGAAGPAGPAERAGAAGGMGSAGPGGSAGSAGPVDPVDPAGSAGSPGRVGSGGRVGPGGAAGPGGADVAAERARRQRLLLGVGAGIVILLLAGGLGLGALLYARATTPRTDTPDATVDNYLRALLVDRSIVDSRTLACPNAGPLAAVEDLRDEALDREKEFPDSRVQISWGALATTTDGPDRVTVETDVSVMGIFDSQVRSRRVDTWRFGLLRDGGWRVCTAVKV